MGFFFRRKKKEEKNIYPADRNVHRVFQLGALGLFAVIIYSLYFDNGNGPKDLSDEQINQRVKIAFQKMAASPEYKKVKDFVELIESKADKKNGNVIDSSDGYIIFIPKAQIEGAKEPITVENTNIKLKIINENTNNASK